MATKVINPKGFLVIETTLCEMVAIGGFGICDFCNNSSFVGYYIAVLNRWYCEKCYEEFTERAIYYEEDKRVELKNYEYYSNQLGV